VPASLAFRQAGPFSNRKLRKNQDNYSVDTYIKLMIKQSKLSFKYKLIVGLGNPGDEYANTYHNAGLLFLSCLAPGTRFKRVLDFAYLKNGDLILVKPLTFMNESGGPVLQALKYFKLTPDKLLVAHDDSDIGIGNYKISLGRGSAGHNGVESIIKSLGNKDFGRLRLGIRGPEKNGKRLRAQEFVLKQISKKDKLLLEGLFQEVKVTLTE